MIKTGIFTAILLNTNSWAVFVVIIAFLAFIAGIAFVIFFFKVVASKEDLQGFMAEFKKTVAELKDEIKKNTESINEHSLTMTKLTTEMEYLKQK